MLPANIANEVKNYFVFSSFEEKFLLELCSFLRPINFLNGEVILSTGDVNKKLFFLRSGEVEVLVDEKRSQILRSPGSVIGEITSLTNTYINSTSRTVTRAECFFLDLDEINSLQPEIREHFLFLFYKLYSFVQTNRLNQTNETAKFMEKITRDLEKAKREIDIITTTQFNFLLTEAEKTKDRRSILFIDDNKKNQLFIKTVLGGTGVKIDIDGGTEDFLGKNNYDLILCNAKFISKLSPLTPRCVIISSLGLNFEILEFNSKITNYITNDIEDRNLASKVLLTTLTKIIHHDLFGLEKYLSIGVAVVSHKIKTSADRDSLREGMIAHFRSRGLRPSLLGQAQICTEELLMNAIYDAPVDTNGNPIYNHLSRKIPVQLEESQHGTFRYATDGVFLALSVEDAFGSLTRETLIKYLKSCYNDEAGRLNDNKGGAGRGLHLIIESADLTIFNIKAKHKTEIICLWSLENEAYKKMNRPTFHFFFS